MKLQCLNSDRISTLPQNIIENISTLMPIRDALRTSILSRNWRSYWKSMPKLVFDDKLVQVESDCEQLTKSKFVIAIFHILLLHTGPILKFKLDIGAVEMDSEYDQIICYLSRNNNLRKLVLEISHKLYKLPSLFFSLQGLEKLKLVSCDFDPPLTFNGFSQLKTMLFGHVGITSKALQHFLSNCPLLTQVVLIGCGGEEDFEGHMFTIAELLQCVPSIRTLQLSQFYMKHLSAGGVPQKRPTLLVQLKNLFLDLCLTEEAELCSALSLIRSSPNLRNIILETFEKLDGPQTPTSSLEFHDYSDLKLDHLEKLEMWQFKNLALELEFVKLIMAKSPMLKKAGLELSDDVSNDEELKFLKDLIRLPFPRASPSAILIIERKKASSRRLLFWCC